MTEYTAPSSVGFEEPAREDGESARGEIILSCEGLCKSYGQIRALDGVTFSVPAGKIVGLLGPNGSGKSTFIKIAVGLLTSDVGSLKICGSEVGVKTKSLVAYLPERSSIPEHFTVREAIQYYSDFFDDFDVQRADDMLAALRIEKNMKIKTLSKGTKEKVQLVMVMSRRAKLYLIDEPISGVDPAARDYIIRTILANYSPSSSVLLSTHLITDIEPIMDAFVLLKEGRVFSVGTPSGLYDKTGKTVDQYFREVFRC